MRIFILLLAILNVNGVISQNHTSNELLFSDSYHKEIYAHRDSILELNAVPRSTGLKLDSTARYFTNRYNNVVYKNELNIYTYYFSGNRKTIETIMPNQVTRSFFHPNNLIDSSVTLLPNPNNRNQIVTSYTYNDNNSIKNITILKTSTTQSAIELKEISRFDTMGNLLSTAKYSKYDTSFEYTEGTEISYNENNQKTSRILYSRSYQTNRIEPALKTTYSYNTNNRLYQFINEEFISARWQLKTKNTFSYHQNGLVSEQLAKNADSIVLGRRTYQYDSNNNLQTFKTYQSRNYLRDSIAITSLISGEILLRMHYKFNTNNQRLYSFETNEYDLNNNLIKHIEMEPGSWDSSGTKVIYIYDSLNNLLETQNYIYEYRNWLQLNYYQNKIDYSIPRSKLILPTNTSYTHKLDTINIFAYYDHFGKFLRNTQTINYYSGFALNIKDPVKNTCTIYPNPTHGPANIDWDDKRGFTLYVLNQAGQVLKKQFIQNSSKTIDLTPYSDGVYYFKLESNEVTETHKVVKL